ncbi:MAG: spondin domain-containing protein [Pseudomonadota bacterium]
MKNHLKKSVLGTVGVLVAAIGAAHATSLTITVENFQTNSDEGNGLSLTPVWFSFLDSSSTFDAFNVGEAASAALEQIAEVGQFGLLDDAAEAAQADAITGAVTAPGGVAGTIDPGESGSIVVEVDPFANDWFQFLSMVVPTNDTFVGLNNPVDLFDDNGDFIGEQVFDITRGRVYDSGTEENILLDGAAFLAGVDGSLGTETVDGVIGPAIRTDFTRELLADGQTFLDPLLARAFLGSPDPDILARVTVSLTPEAPVPVPGAALLFGSIFAGGAAMRSKRRKA